jgi:hypothetical protein
MKLIVARDSNQYCSLPTDIEVNVKSVYRDIDT